MNPRPANLPILCVEGPDDVSAIAALLKQYGVDTKQGQEHLYIKCFGSVEQLLETMPDIVKSEREHACGFVLDIDIECSNRWQAVQDRLKFGGDPSTKLESTVPTACPPTGYYGKVKDYPNGFGVWLMPDCKSDGQMLENLLPSLMSTDDPLWPHAQEATKEAARLVDAANMKFSGTGSKWKRFSDKVTIKAEIRCWLAWQKEPGVGLGAAINSHILGHDSPEARAFLKWIKDLYNLPNLTGV